MRVKVVAVSCKCCQLAGKQLDAVSCRKAAVCGGWRRRLLCSWCGLLMFGPVTTAAVCGSQGRVLLVLLNSGAGRM